MKKMTRISVFAAAGILLAGSAFAAEEKIGFVDLGKLLQESTAYQGFMMQREKEAKNVSARLEKEKEALIKKEQEIKDAQAELSKAELGEKLDELDAQKKEFTEKLVATEQKLRESTEEGLKKIQEKGIDPVMKSLAEKNGYQAILNLNMALYVGDEVNVTEQAIEQVNKKLPKMDFPKIEKPAKAKSAKKKK